MDQNSSTCTTHTIPIYSHFQTAFVAFDFKWVILVQHQRRTWGGSKINDSINWASFSPRTSSSYVGERERHVDFSRRAPPDGWRYPNNISELPNRLPINHCWSKELIPFVNLAKKTMNIQFGRLFSLPSLPLQQSIHPWVEIWARAMGKVVEYSHDNEHFFPYFACHDMPCDSSLPNNRGYDSGTRNNLLKEPSPNGLWMSSTMFITQRAILDVGGSLSDQLTGGQDVTVLYDYCHSSISKSMSFSQVEDPFLVHHRSQSSLTVLCPSQLRWTLRRNFPRVCPCVPLCPSWNGSMSNQGGEERSVLEPWKYLSGYKWVS